MRAAPYQKLDVRRHLCICNRVAPLVSETSLSLRVARLKRHVMIWSLRSCQMSSSKRNPRRLSNCIQVFVTSSECSPRRTRDPASLGAHRQLPHVALTLQNYSVPDALLPVARRSPFARVTRREHNKPDGVQLKPRQCKTEGGSRTRPTKNQTTPPSPNTKRTVDHDPRPFCNTARV